MEHTKPDITLSDGREIVFDFNKASIREIRSLFDVNQPDEEEFRIIGKLIGIDTEEVSNFGYLDWTNLVKTFRAKIRELNTNPT